jgi:hypothetical protein
MLTEPVRKMGNEHLQTQMTIEHTLQDNTRQPKHTDEERAKRFESLTIKKTNHESSILLRSSSGI